MSRLQSTGLRYYGEAALSNVSALTQDGDLYLSGIITAPQPDAEGGVYSAESMDLAALVEDGYLDVNHLMFESNIPEAVIGVPVEVRRVRGGVWARFKLNGSQLAKDIWNYANEHPGLLGFSIAGGLLKPLFERGGEWLFDKAHGGSVGICRFPMNPHTAAFASSGAALAASAASLSAAGLKRIMQSVVLDMKARKLAPTAPYETWYRYFLGLNGDPMAASTLASWAQPYFKGLADTQNMIERIKNTIIVPDDVSEDIIAETARRAAEWLAVHPDDPHFSSDGKFRTLNDLIEHLRGCCLLSPLQIARVAGFARKDPKRLLSYPPREWTSGAA